MKFEVQLISALTERQKIFFEAHRYSLYSGEKYVNLSFYDRKLRTYKSWRGKEISVYDETCIFSAQYFKTSVTVKSVG